MFNSKWAVIPAVAAFALAFIVSLSAQGVGFALALLRSLGFAALFFGMGWGAWTLVSRFLPDLLEMGSNGRSGSGIFAEGSPAEAPGDTPAEALVGGNLSVTLSDGPVATPGELYGVDGIGNIAELVLGRSPVPGAPADVDQAPAKGYNGVGAGASDTSGLGFASFASGLADADADSGAGLGDFSSFFDGLTGFDAAGDAGSSMMDIFDGVPGLGSFDAPEETAKPARKPRGARLSVEQKDADYNPQELAVGIRTVLATERRG